ncbi:farnesol dehydrogenase-like [Athalia rosae]|uniref:farnesol dehydrogenase-like n=1 Tax=Athalia rosae TaxID=37344 RepID=UPI0020341EE8|nr:farnesol dehydrogenase-like [Athalia rosae]
MDRWVGKVAVVTGASSGIGAAIVEALVKEGLLVVGLARRLELLDQLSAKLKGAKGKLFVRRCDVSKEEDLVGSFEWVTNELGGTDVLVNNAGIWSNTAIIDDDIDGFRKLLDVNILAVASGIGKAVASMRERGVAGHIVNINSVDGHFIPFNETTSLYPASKYAMTAMTEGVRRELVANKTKIKITSISPGFVKTDIIRATGIPNWQEYFNDLPHLQAKDIADAVLYVLSTPENVQVTELTVRPVGETC